MKSVTDAAPSLNGQTADIESALPNHAPTAPPALDPFDPARLRLTQDFASAVGVKKMLLTIPVRKPSKEWFVRVHPDEGYRLTTAVIELKEEDRETFLVDPKLWPELSAESTFSPRIIFTAITRQGNLFLWPIRLPGSDGRTNTWNSTQLEAAEMARKSWVRVAANMSLGAYDVFIAETDAPATWPQEPFSELLKIAFKEQFIETLDHPVLKRLRGES